MYLVVVDHDYYPFVEEYDTYGEALKAYMEAVMEWHTPDGDHDGTIYLTEVDAQLDVKTVY